MQLNIRGKFTVLNAYNKKQGTDFNQTCGHLAIYTNIESYCTPETNVNYTSIKKIDILNIKGTKSLV